MIIAGLDEAALGPKLGPFCVCLTRFKTCQDPESQAELGKTLSGVISSDKNDRNRIPVGDSKKLFYSGNTRGLEILEKGVLSFLRATGTEPPSNFAELIALLSGNETVRTFQKTPWLEGAEKLSLPLSDGWETPESEQKYVALKHCLEDQEIEVLLPNMQIVTANLFNREITTAGGKGGAIQNIIAPLIISVLERKEDPVKLTVDRQGGRRYYGEWLVSLLPGTPILATEESPQRSAYRIGKHTIEFLVKADAVNMETALASMFAKYCREASMLLFNQWWSHQVPYLKPTAGYPQDAKRFITEVKKAGALPENTEILIRSL